MSVIRARKSEKWIESKADQDQGASFSAKKRKFRGNQHSDEVGTDFASTSTNKIRESKDGSFDVSCNDSIIYCFIQFSLVFSVL